MYGGNITNDWQELYRRFLLIMYSDGEIGDIHHVVWVSHKCNKSSGLMTWQTNLVDFTHDWLRPVSPQCKLSTTQRHITYISIGFGCFNTLNVATGFTTHSKSFCFSTFSQFQTFLNQYQACLYLFECIFQGDSKYGHDILQFWHFWTFCNIYECVVCLSVLTC